MSDSLICPQCGQKTSRFVPSCLSCGSDISQATSVAAANKLYKNESPIVSPKKPRAIKTRFIVIAIITAWILVSLFGGSKKNLSAPSYYVNDAIVSSSTTGTPDNRMYVVRGGAFSLIIYYPESVSRRFAGYGEHMMWKTDATHHAHIGLGKHVEAPLRYRIKRFELRSASGESYPFYFFQRDIFEKGVGKKLRMTKEDMGEGGAASIMRNSSKDLSLVDFSFSDNLAEPYFGFNLKKPPSSLVLSFEIEVYSLDRKFSRTVADEVKLQRINSDPRDYMKRSRN